MTNQICRNEVEKNIINVQFGKPLTLPLRTLNESCKFRKIWEKYSGGTIGLVGNPIKRRTKKSFEEIKAQKKAYRREHKEEYRAQCKVYYQEHKEEIKAHSKVYQQRKRRERQNEN